MMNDATAKNLLSYQVFVTLCVAWRLFNRNKISMNMLAFHYQNAGFSVFLVTKNFSVVCTRMQLTENVLGLRVD